MPERQMIDAMWDDSPVDVSKETSMIWSIANKLRGTYQSDKYKEVIISMTIIRLFECVLAAAKGIRITRPKPCAVLRASSSTRTRSICLLW